MADLDELRTLLEPVRDAGRGVVALLPGGVFSNDEVFELQAEIGRPFTWTALLTIKGIPYHDEAWSRSTTRPGPRGIEVWPQVSCRPLVFQMNLAEPFTLNMRDVVPGADGPSARRAASPPTAIRRGGPRRGTSCPASSGAPAGQLRRRCRWPSRARHPELVGRSVLELADERGVHRRST